MTYWNSGGMKRSVTYLELWGDEAVYDIPGTLGDEAVYDILELWGDEAVCDIPGTLGG